MSQDQVEKILGGPPLGIDRANYWPIDAPAPRKGLIWHIPRMEVWVVFDDDGKVLAAGSRPRRPDTFSEAAMRWLRMPWW